MNYRIFVNIYEQFNGVAYDHYYREKKGPERDQDGMFQQRDKFGMQAAFEDFEFREALQHIIFLEVLFAEQCEVYLQWTSSFEPLLNIKDNTPVLVTHSKLPQHINLMTFNDDKFQGFRGTKLAGYEFVTTTTCLLCSQIFD
ncbi:hypothetical protein TNCV_722151 [Trichonephila clavipes]|nr:hypothetical protein TNCV_722151 [Trichonephila clavipes]